MKEICGVPLSVHHAILFRELGQRPLEHAWWRRIVQFWNALAALPPGHLYRQIAIDSWRDATTHKVKNWSSALHAGLRSIGYQFPTRSQDIITVDLPALVQLLDGGLWRVWYSYQFALGHARLQMPRSAHMTSGLLGLLG